MLVKISGLDYSEIKKQCPKTCAKLSEFMKANLEAFQKSMMEDIASKNDTIVEDDWEIPPITPEIVQESIENMLSAGAMRSLYEFFDSSGVNMCPIPPQGSLKWDYKICMEGKLVNANPTEYNGRVEAEIAGFKESFNVMEGKL